MATPAAVGDAVLVTWRDAVASVGWHEYDEVNTDTVDVTTVGLLYAADERALTVVLSQNDGSINGSITIPADWVQRVRVLRRNVAK